jgi:hypothetical protein
MLAEATISILLLSSRNDASSGVLEPVWQMTTACSARGEIGAEVVERQQHCWVSWFCLCSSCAAGRHSCFCSCKLIAVQELQLGRHPVEQHVCFQAVWWLMHSKTADMSLLPTVYTASSRFTKFYSMVTKVAAAAPAT